MPCADYENRPTICREITCGEDCSHCGDCDNNVTLTFEGTIGGDTVGFLLLHGVIVEQNDDCHTLIFPLPCKNYVTVGDT